MKVVDTTNNLIGFDSTISIFSRKYYSGDISTNILKGDSVLLRSYELVGSDLPINSVEWFPKSYLSSPYTSETWAKPEKFTIYTVHVIDTAGCEGLAISEHVINILYTSIDQFKKKMNVSYNYITNNFEINNKALIDGDTKIIVYNINGQVLLNSLLENDNIQIHTTTHQLFYVIVRGNSIIDNGRILIF